MSVAVYARPNLSEDDAKSLAERLFRLHSNTILSLPSERDQNFYIKDPSDKEFILKIAGPAEKIETLDMQNKAMNYLNDRMGEGFFPRVCLTASNEEIATITSASGLHYCVRLLTYLPGRVFVNVRPHSPALLRSLGELLGKVDAELMSFSHSAANRELKWDLQNSAWIRQYTKQIPDASHREMIEQSLRRFDKTTAPLLDGLRKSIIHNDANDYNILVQIDDAGEMRASGLIDFGDMLHSYMISELAVALAYVMMDKPDPLSAACHVISGYNAVFPLSEPEIEVLFDLICMRLCVSVTNSALEQKREPGNVYLTISEKPAWALLEKLFAVDPTLAHY